MKSTDVKLCIEFNRSHIVKSVRMAVDIASRSSSGNVDVLFDPAHYHFTPSKLEMLDADSVPFISASSSGRYGRQTRRIVQLQR